MRETMAVAGQFVEVVDGTTIVFADKPYVRVTVIVDGKPVVARLSPEAVMDCADLLIRECPEFVDKRLANQSAMCIRYVKRVAAAKARQVSRLRAIGVSAG